ncbi:MAG: hypothetical protein GXW90_04240 [Tepidanaerobacter acetatoxydans]|nr:hypothetical protein [Tepidanaerobacter acetatoxydans]
MITFDKNEQDIHDALSRITVDESKLVEQVKRRLNEQAPNTIQRRMRRPMTAAIALVMSVMLFVTVAVAAQGGFDWFIKRFNPSFGEIAEPVEAYCEDQGIRMEVIGAQKYDNMAVIYLSLQDVSGQNRLTEQTDFQDGFTVKMNTQAQEEAKGQTDEIVASFGYGQKMLYFDEETNTIYYEFTITADADSPLADPLELGSFLIYFDKRSYEEPVSISLSDIKEAETVSIRGGQIWGGSDLPDDLIWGRSSSDLPDDLDELTTVLAPGNYAPMPHGEADQWISNIGIINGKLHVQTGKLLHKEFGSTDPNLNLKTPDGYFINPDYVLDLYGDKDCRLLDLEESDYGDAVYRYEEAIFSIDTEELDGYTLCYAGSVYSGVKGRWKVAVNLSDTSRKMRIITNDIPVEGHLFEHMTLSPLGLQVIGSYTGEECMASGMSMAVETADGVIPLHGGGGSLNSQKKTFNLHWNTEAPLDVATVTAVIINDTRIPVQSN